MGSLNAGSFSTFNTVNCAILGTHCLWKKELLAKVSFMDLEQVLVGISNCYASWYKEKLNSDIPKDEIRYYFHYSWIDVFGHVLWRNKFVMVDTIEIILGIVSFTIIVNLMISCFTC